MILQRLLDIVSVYDSALLHNNPKIDPALEYYLKALFMDEDEDEFNADEVANLLKEHIPESSAIPSKVLTEWILETRKLIMGASDGETGSSVSRGKPVNDPTTCGGSSHLTQFLPSIREVREEACRTSKFRDVVDDDEYPKLTSDERLATMERYGFSPFTKSKPPSHAPEITEPSNAVGCGKLRYLNGEVVDTTGKRYIEIAKTYPNMPKPVYLKAARKYRFH